MNDDHSVSRSVVFTDQVFIGCATDLIQMVLSDPRADDAATLLAKVADLSIFMAFISGKVVCYFVDEVGCEVFAIDPDLDPGPTRPNRVSGMAAIVVVLADAIGSGLLVAASPEKEGRDILESDNPVPVADLLGQAHSAASLRSLLLKLNAAGIEPRLAAAYRRNGVCRNLKLRCDNVHLAVTPTIAVADVLSSSAFGPALTRAARASNRSARDGARTGGQFAKLGVCSSLSAHLAERLLNTGTKISTNVGLPYFRGLIADAVATLPLDSVSFNLLGQRLERVAKCGRLAPNDVFPVSLAGGAYVSAGRWSQLGYAKLAWGGGWTFNAASLPLDWTADHIAVNHARGLKTGTEMVGYWGMQH